MEEASSTLGLTIHLHLKTCDIKTDDVLGELYLTMGCYANEHRKMQICL